jgi:hypothetical protein
MRNEPIRQQNESKQGPHIHIPPGGLGIFSLLLLFPCTHRFRKRERESFYIDRRKTKMSQS